ncbi:MAG: ATP-binding protein, partial [Gammaproteobacteria bacterium]|nr:ATP-binding protein [Gammaproteobacteria bacterium]
LYNLQINVPRIIKADHIRIRQVLTNLIGNAIKFTEKGYVHLNIEHDGTSDEDAGIKFTVSDTGIGMNKSHKKTIFDAFSQADSSITRRFGGTGLGLTISRNLVRLMYGSIGFDSVYGEGSTFWFTIPVECINKSSADILEQHNNKHVALIDNHLHHRRSTISMLESWGYTVAVYDHKSHLDSDNKHSPEYFDAQIVNIYRPDLHEKDKEQFIPENTDIPSLAIVSTRSYKELKNICHIGFDDAAFRSSKQVDIKNSLTNIIEKNETTDVQEDTTISDKKDWSGFNILVVDDNDINLKLAELLLKSRGANTVTATSGEESIECAKKQDFDLIFMDIHMPGLDGYEATKRIRSLKSKNQAVIIALTANAMAKEKTIATESGMNDLLIKPISEQLVQDTIDKWLYKSPEIKPQTIPTNTKTKLETFSRDEAIELAAGNENLATELLAMLIEELPIYRAEIESAFMSNSKTRLKDNTHKIHGASRCCGTPALRHAAHQLENAIDNNIEEQLETNINLLIYEIDQLIKANPEDLHL